MCTKNSNLLRKFDSTLVDLLCSAYANKSQSLNGDEGISLHHEPFAHCCIADLVSDENFVDALEAEMKTKLKYAAKNNDLYKFSQVNK